MNNEFICGINSVFEALRAGRRRVFSIYVAAGKKNPGIDKIVQFSNAKRVKINEVSRQKISDLTNVETNQGVAAEVEPFKYLEIEELLGLIKRGGRPAFIVLLDQISDPHNLGAIIRTAHLLGADGIVIPKDNAADITPSAAKAASGAIEHLPIIKVTNLNTAINVLKNNNIWVSGADGTATKTIYDYDFTTPSAIVLGGEGKGLRRLVSEQCDELLSIPMAGKIDSFNVSVAGAIFMSEVMRQRLCKNRAICVKKT